MYSCLGEETLKTGERLEVGVVRAPDAEWAAQIVPLLGHKNPDYRAHIRRALEGPLDDLQTRFYVGHVDGRVISQVMIVGDRGAGILGHVYTLPDERRKGACAAIFGHLMEDVRRAGFRVICLGTGFETPPYWIYHSFGFRSVAPGSGCMKWLAEPEAEAELFRPAPATVRDLRWDDWGYFDLLALQPPAEDEELPRSPTLGIKAQGSAEGPFVSFRIRSEREPRIQAKVLVSETGATVGWALLAPDSRWFGDVWLLEVHAHPQFTGWLPELLHALELPEGPVAAYLSGAEGPKAAALSGAGFRPAVLLQGWLSVAEGRRDMAVWLHP